MKNQLRKLLSLFVLSASALALPGMSSVKYDFSLNEELFSQTAISCQNKIQGNAGLLSISKFANQMNCNAIPIERPEDFCRCVSTISSNGIKIDTEKASMIEKTIEDASLTKVIESSALEVSEFKYYDDLLKLLSSGIGWTSCIDSILLEESQDNAKDTNNNTYKTMLKKAVYEQVQEDLKKQKPLSQEEIYSQLKSITHSTYLSFDNKRLGGRVPTLKGLAWEKVSSSPVKNILKLDRSIENNLVKFKQMKNTQASSKHILDGAVVKVCDRLKAHMSRIVDNTDVKHQKDLIKASIDNPNTDVKSKMYQIIEKDIVMNLNEIEEDETRASAQDFIFSMDILYCKKLQENNLELTSAQDLDEAGDIVDEVGHYAKAEEKAKIEKESHQKLLAEQDLRLKEISSEVVIRERAIDILDELLEGKHAIQKGGELHLNLEDKDFLKKVKTVDAALYDNIMIEVNSGSPYIINKDKLKGMKEQELSIVSMIKDEYEDIETNRKSTLLKYNAATRSLASIKMEKNKLLDDLSSKYGEGVALQVLADSHLSVSKSLRTKNSIDTLISYSERENYPQSFDKKDLELYDQTKQFAVNKSIPEANVINSDVIEEFNNSQTVVNTERVQENHFITSKENTSYQSHNPVQSELNQENSIGDSIRNTDTSREKELERKISELERLAYDNATTKASNNSNDIQIAEIKKLKYELEVQKINNEREKLSRSLKELNADSTPSSSVVSKVNSGSELNSPSSNAQSVRSIASVRQGSAGPTTQVNSASIGGGSSRPISSDTYISQPTSNPSNTSRDSSLVDDSNYQKSKVLSLSSNITGASQILSNGLEISGISPEIAASGTRVVKIDFDVNQVNSDGREELITALFADGEDEIILETLNGLKLLVKNTSQRKAKKIEKKVIPNDMEQRKKRHQDLIELLKIGRADTRLD